ncbi:MAG: hypothetical protein HY264_01055 [Chloroflexi bacterium]|nr:hypothetical protein [Chloroflexota bacterium]
MLAILVPASALAGGQGATVVRGIQHEYGSCGDADGYAMDGALVGCWWVDTFEVKPMPAQGTMLATGREHFVGCLGTVCGSFETTYTYTARFDGQTELHDRCHHPLDPSKGTGGFTGARGELSFTDVIDSQPFFYPYWGNIQLVAGAGASTVSAPAAAGRAATTAAAAVSAPC